MEWKIIELPYMTKNILTSKIHSVDISIGIVIVPSRAALGIILLSVHKMYSLPIQWKKERAKILHFN